ncbi:hypothetical protein I0Q12_11315 [Rhodococcus sp. CX]|uniref:hypothetical protein n=2 Tax=unclassified Rhodococcus (in: high G+C Gram-positive bacteria) TaxID=192944 RepID=UPI0018CDF7FD|nr:hypothetical protein [Rhodococcus sp. CX]MBH0120069.1 hypothetical protein [Rhodococcus sp. CX]
MAKEFETLLVTQDEQAPQGRDRHPVLGNYATHQTPAIKAQWNTDRMPCIWTKDCE